MGFTQKHRYAAVRYAGWVLSFKWHRYLVRQYLYPVLCIILLLLLIQWNLNAPQRRGWLHDDEDGDDWRHIVKEKTKKQQQPPPPVGAPIPVPIPVDIGPVDGSIKEAEGGKAGVGKPVKGNTVALAVYMEAQCPDTTGFVKRQLVPTWEKIGYTHRILLHLVPFGKAKCERKDGDIVCECQHGPAECELNQLMNCAIERLPSPDTHVPLIGCVQGNPNLEAAFQSCIPTTDPNYQWLWECSHSVYGRELLFKSGQETSAIKDFDFVPWVMIRGQRVNDAFYALEENLCKRLDEPKPAECGQNFRV